MRPSDTASRREFLGAASAAAVVSSLGSMQNVHAGGSDSFRVALIGSGNRGTGAVVDCLHVSDQIQIVALADAFENRAQQSAALLKEYVPAQYAVPDDQVFVGLDSYKHALACDIDLAILTAPPGFRPLHYQAAIEAGKHVFMEKPLCVDAGGFRKMMATNALADQKKLKVGVGLFRRHNPAYQEAVRRVHAGELGPVQFMRCYGNMAAWGAHERKPDETELAYQLRNWRVFDWLGGGRLVEAHCHELDVMDWVMKDHPVDCNGVGGRTELCAEPRFGQDYDHHMHEYTYANGVKMFSQSRCMDRVWAPISEHVHGAQGSMDLSGKILEINFFRRREKTNPYHKEWEDLMAAIWAGNDYNEAWFGTTSSFSGVLGREASYSGLVVTWDELASRGPDLFPAEELTWESQPPVMPDQNGSYAQTVKLPGFYKPY